MSAARPLRKVPAPSAAPAPVGPALAAPAYPAALPFRGLAHRSPTRSEIGSLAGFLLAERLVPPHAMLRALALQRDQGGHLSDILATHDMVAEKALFDAMARHWGVRRVDPLENPPDPVLVDALGAATCLRNRLLPWRQIGRATVVLTAQPEDFATHHAALTESLGPVVMALAPPDQIEAAVLAVAGPAMARMAECRVPAQESCRAWATGRGPARLALGAVLILLGLWVVPALVVAVLTAWVLLTLAATAGLKLAATVAAMRADGRAAPHIDPPPLTRPADLPVVSIMVALYREADIAARLVRRLERLDYPRKALDVVLVVEATDTLTRDALARAGLPAWMRVVPAPPGRVKTKPRALNYALPLCRGSVIGVYDAEDAPARSQILRVVDHFSRRGPEVACLQGTLDFYNPRFNWLARCFTMEYAAWFRVVLPGLARLGLPVPLGGTTLFFRRAALEALGAWDAHNVTEDADLGVRLCRHGYRTELIDTVTEEEANCSTWPWVKQRSRWLKGYMMTWAVHMRDPALLWRQLGPRGFWGFQVLFLDTLSQFLLAPLLWSFWLVPLGVAHPVADALPGPVLGAVMGLFLFSEAVNLWAGWRGMRRTAHGFSPLWLLTLHAYFPLAALASYKAAWELLVRPFYWDKTSHGQFDLSAPHGEEGARPQSDARGALGRRAPGPVVTQPKAPPPLLRRPRPARPLAAPKPPPVDAPASVAAVGTAPHPAAPQGVPRPGIAAS